MNLDARSYRRGDAGYEEARRDAVWNARTPERFPGLIVQAETEEDVVGSVRLARREGMRIGVRSGGHSWAGNHLRDGGMLIDVSGLVAVTVDADAMKASVQPGCPGNVFAAGDVRPGRCLPSVDGAAVTDDGLEAYLERPLSPPDPEALAAIEAGPIDAGDALPRSDLGRLLDPAALPAESGWCTLPDGVGYVAARTAMPGVTGEMVDWWFQWHPHDALRYRVWHPKAHVSNRVDLPHTAGAKAHWGTVHHPVEDVGTGVVHARIAFHPPTKLGFSTDALDDPRVATIVCGYAGDDRTGVRHTLMIHVFMREDDGVVLRSRFWLGAALPRILNNRPMRRLALPPELPHALARHCVEEYANLGALLPELHARFATA